jgi:hypothetical protein
VADADRERLVGYFLNLNHTVTEQLGDDFQLGHSYFMRSDIATQEGLNRVWRRAVRPLLEEYFHHHRDRESLLSAMAPPATGQSEPAGSDVDSDA